MTSWPRPSGWGAASDTSRRRTAAATAPLGVQAPDLSGAPPARRRRRPAGRAPVRGPRRPRGQSATHRRLPRPHRHERDPRRALQLAPQPAPARGARLHVRRHARSSTCAAPPDRSPCAARSRRRSRRRPSPTSSRELSRIREAARRGRRARSPRGTTSWASSRFASRARPRSPAALAGLVIHGLPDDELDRYRPTVAAVTAEAVAARRHARTSTPTRRPSSSSATSLASRRRCGTRATARSRSSTTRASATVAA